MVLNVRVCIRKLYEKGINSIFITINSPAEGMATLCRVRIREKLKTVVAKTEKGLKA